MRLKHLFFLGLFLGFWACQPAPSLLKNSDNEALYKGVIALHDSVMLKTNREVMIEQNRLRKHLAMEQDSTRKVDILKALSSLKRAEDDMMQWMADFKGVEMDSAYYAGLEANKIQDYLKNEYEIIKKVGLLTDSAIGQAQALKFDN